MPFPAMGAVAGVRIEEMSMGKWLALLLGISLLTVIGLRWLSRRAFLAGRERQPLEDIHASIEDQLSPATFNEVWSVVGTAFSVDPHLIRPTDTFRNLGKFDSWSLGKGQDDIGEWLETKGIRPASQIQTVLDLARLVETSAQANTKSVT